MDIKWVGASSNNYDSGRGGKSVNKIVLHWIVGTLESCDATFANPDRKASSHYGIGDGDIHQYVKEEDTAWHASNYSVNQESIGIEHEGGWLLDDGTRKKPSDKTHETSGMLVADICRRYNLPINRTTIHAHSEYSATQCPGSLDIDRIISIAQNYTVPDQPDISDPQAKIDFGGLTTPLEVYNVLELQEVKSKLMAKDRVIFESQGACDNRVKEAEEQVITETNEFWQPKLASANDEIVKLNQTISNLDEKKLSEYDWQVLFKQAWKNFWEQRGGDGR